MKALTWIRSRPRTLASAAGVTAGVIALTTMALTYEGIPTTEVDLNDGGVWITKSSDLLLGHFNSKSTVLDGGLRASGNDFDILQDEATVVLVNSGDNTATLVDPARVSLGDSATLPGSAKVSLGDKTTAVLDSASGYLWVVPAKELSAFEAQGADPILELGKNADVVVGQDGTVYAVSAAESAIYTIPVGPNGEPLEASSQSLEGLTKKSTPTITAVGDMPVVMDAAKGVIMTPGGLRTEVAGADKGVLQQASLSGENVLLATETDLVRVPFDGSEPTMTSSTGRGVPSAPVALLGCEYGAWSGSGMFVRDCPSSANDLTSPIDAVGPDANLTFRVNRDVIILNDSVAGAAWMATDSLMKVDDWNDITPPEGEAEEDENTTEETVETSLPERTDINTVPIAEPDSFGVRPGATTLLPILDNDTDADGDVLVATVKSDQPSIGSVEPINNGSAMQIAVSEDRTGAGSFEYEINDGRGGTSAAAVSLTVHDWNMNSEPKVKRPSSIAVEVGGTVSYNVLPDWMDPDGDDIYLQNVIPAEGDDVEFTTDGQITYRATGSQQGRVDVEVTVTDGLGMSARGILSLDVRPVGSTDPKTNADHVVTLVNQQVTVAPLSNDTSASREPLNLARVEPISGVDIVPDYANKTFTFSASSPGSYYVQYLASSGPKSASGLVRVDVSDQVREDLPPVAVRDVALLPTGGEALVGVLNNDTDPAGGILVVQSISVEPGSGVSVSVLNHQTLRIGDQGALDEQVRVTYRVSNGSQTAEGELVIIPIPAPSKLLPPVVVNDEAVVRAGDVVTIPVLDNDSHPNDDVMHVVPNLAEPLIDPVDGEAFVSQDEVRFKAGPEAKTVYATYEVVDSTGQTSAGLITITILPVDEETNSAPRPLDVTARALSGSTINFAIPLDGIDSDGDSVELLGIASNPSKGRIVEVAQNYFVYEAFEGSTGVDTFSYRVRDRLGKEGTATIRVGIAPSEDVNQAPYAVKDAVVVRPGREVAVPVMANDSDPEGEKVALVKEGLTLSGEDGISARVSGDRVLVEVPDRELETSLQYEIVDERGATATAVLQVTVDEDVPLLAPIARDDRVKSEDVVDGLTVDLAILENDEDPDGVVENLTVDLGEGATQAGEGKVRVTITEQMQLIRYTITDVDDQATSAFIFVPALQDLRPTIKPSTKPVEVVSGETKELPLADYVTVAGGGTVRITEAEKVSAMKSNGADLIADPQTLVYTSADGYFGQDAVTFEVTDGTGPDDPNGRKATLTIPINVLPPANQQPQMTAGEIEVAAGEDPASLDLAPLVTDPDPEDKHSFTYVSGASAGITARMDGTRIVVEANEKVKKGTVATLNVRVTDGETDPVDGQVTVRVGASTRALATANTDSVPEADQGETVEVAVLSNDFNPFPETPLELVSAVTESGSGSVETAGDLVRVTSAKDFVGTIVVRYRIKDATDDVDREVEGKVIVTVQGVPDAPGTPVVSSVQDRTVVMSWSTPANNGAPITGYTVTSVQGDAYSKECTSTTCTLNGLTNNVKYVFQVTATNRVGDSEPSRSSQEARPDARPDTPSAPVLAFGDRSLDISWATPTTPGSPVESYTLEISPAPPSGVAQKTATGNQLTWEGLENGTEYRIRVRAHNLAPEPSSWSAWSTGMVPAAPPAAPAAPTTSELTPVGDQAQMQVNWIAPNNNGDAIDGYELQVRNGSQTVNTIPVTAMQRNYAVTVPTSETGYTYMIRAQNKAGWGAWSPLSAERRGVLAPAAPTGVSASVPGNNSSIDVSFTALNADQRNGARPEEIRYEYSLNNGNWSAASGTSFNVGGLSNGTTYTVRIRAVATVGGTSYASGASGASNGVVPYGPVRAPSATAENQGTTVKMTWSAPSANGRAITSTEIRIDGGGWETVNASGTRTSGSAYSTTHSIEVRVTDAAGQTATNSASARTNDPPPEILTTIKGSAGQWPGQCDTPTCAHVTLKVENFRSPGTYHLFCEDNNRFGGRAQYVPANGTVELGCFYGQPGNTIRVWIQELDRHAAPLTWY